MFPRCVLPVKTSGVCRDLLVIPLASCGTLLEFQKVSKRGRGGVCVCDSFQFVTRLTRGQQYHKLCKLLTAAVFKHK